MSRAAPVAEPDDVRWMGAAIALAAAVDPSETDPNPRVGAIIVAPDGRELAAGVHARWGGPHAEAAALADAAARGVSLRGGTAYVTLEPCSHHGKTPPCADALLAAGLARVVIGAADPNPLVDGRGAARLRDAGLRVVDGVLTAEARALNEPFHLVHESGRPFLTLKWAMSLDGRIATGTGESQWISSESARAATHALRGRCDAILVGRGTAATDDPRLTVRHAASLARGRAGRPPLRVVLDAGATLDPASRLGATAREVPVLVIAGPSADPARVAALEAVGVEVLTVEAAAGGGVALGPALALLAARGVGRLLVEGGARVGGALVAARLVDEVVAVIAPVILGDAGAPGPLAGPWTAETVAGAPRLLDPAVERHGPDLLVRGRLRYAER